MKNRKLLGALIALGGSVAAIGTAFALYKVEPTAQDIIISAKTTADVELHAGVVNADNTHAMLYPGDEHRTRTIELSAGFTPTANSCYIQSYYMAKLTFKVSSESEAFIENVAPNSWIELGVQSGDNAYGSFWGWTWSDSEHKTGDRSGTHDNNHLNGNAMVKTKTSVSWTTNYPIFSGQDVSRFLFHVQLKDNITDDEYLAIAESQYSVEFSVEQPEDYDYAYIVGSATSSVEEKAWVDKDEFQMTVNAKADCFQWMFTTGTVEGKGKLINEGTWKLRKHGAENDTYCCNQPDHVWYTYINEVLMDGKTFYWDGTHCENSEHTTWNGQENVGHLFLN